MKPGKRRALFLFNTADKKYNNFTINIVTIQCSHLLWRTLDEDIEDWVDGADKWLILFLWKVRALIIYNTGSLSRLSDTDLAQVLHPSVCL